MSPAFAALTDIGWAVERIRNGCKVRRRGWNATNLWICLSPGFIDCPASALWAPCNTQYALENGGKATVRPYVTMKCADGTIVPWTCSQSDLLETDWEIA